MLRIAICDDEKLHRDYAAKLTAREAAAYQPEIETFESAAALESAMSNSDYIPDIAILDIQMEGTDGITLARRINAADPLCRIIFLTSYLHFATDVYSAEHIYFIVKKEIESRIGPALTKAITELSSARCVVPSITVKSGAATTVLPLGDILFLERTGRKTRIVASSGELRSAAAPAELLGTAETHFIRSHQSFWVNPGKIVTMQHDAFLLTDGTRVPISRSCRQEAKTLFFVALRENSQCF